MVILNTYFLKIQIVLLFNIKFRTSKIYLPMFNVYMCNTQSIYLYMYEVMLPSR